MFINIEGVSTYIFLMRLAYVLLLLNQVPIKINTWSEPLKDRNEPTFKPTAVRLEGEETYLGFFVGKYLFPDFPLLGTSQTRKVSIFVTVCAA